MKILSIILLFLATTGYATEHPVYEQILRNKPTINKAYAMKLSNTIHHAARKHKVPKHIYTAILMQESQYRLNAVSRISGELNGKIVTINVDYGMSQINYRNVRNYHYKVDKLLTDVVYSIEAGAHILSIFKFYKKTDKYWWTRYHSGNKIRRDEYKRLVKRYL